MYQDMVLNDSPVRYWRMGEASGNLTDLIAQAVATKVGTPTYGQTPQIFGDPTTSILLPTASDSGRYTFGNVSLAVDYSIEFWIGAVVAAGLYNAILTYNSGAGGFYLRGSTTPKKLMFYEGGDKLGSGVPAIVAGGSYHIVLSVVGGVGTFYVNGVADATTVSGLLAHTNWNGIGDTASSVDLGGKWEELAVYGYGLSGAQILAHYNLGKSGLIPVRALAV